MDKARLTEIAALLEKATGPDRRIDGLLEVAVEPERRVIVGHKPGRFPQEPICGAAKELVLTGPDLADYLSAPPFTASLDAALALVERVLPGWHHSVVLTPPDGCEAYIWERGKLGKTHQEKAPTPALALCLALVRAKLDETPAQPSRDGGE